MNPAVSEQSSLELAATRFALLDHAPIGEMVVGADLTVLFWNRCLELWTGLPRANVVGQPLFELFPHLAAAKYASRIRSVFLGGAPTIFSAQLHPYLIPAPLPGGKFRAQYTVVTGIPGETPGSFAAVFAIQDVTSLTEAIDGHRQVLERLLSEREVRRKAEEALLRSTTELKRLNRSLKQRSISDGLTGVYNHRYFYQVLKRDFIIAQRSKSDYACLLLDLDHFKLVNDTWGHLFGDKVLKGIGQLLSKRLRKTDLVARYGGEEFAILLPDVALVNAVEVAEAIRCRIAEHTFRNEGVAVKVTASIGVACRCAHRPETPTDLLTLADQALYLAKERGRNQVQFVSPVITI